jgi:hypothetical protein
MRRPVYTIDWSHRRVAWLVLRPLSELNAAAALEAAAERLRKSDAGVKPDPAGATLHFWCVSRTRRSWLACISNGRVDAAPVGDQLSVTVGAGLRPVAIYGTVAALIGTLLRFPSTWVIGFVALIAGGNYLFAHFGLLRVAEAVLYAGPVKRAA